MARNHALEILESDHTRVRQLLGDLTGKDGQVDALVQILVEVENHTSLEEEIFYPAFREAVAGTPEEQICFEYLEKHDLVDIVLSNIQDDEPESMEFAARAKVLRELLERHIEEEEQFLFPRVRELFSEEELLALGERLVERREQLASAEDEDLDEGDEDLDEDELDDEDMDEMDEDEVDEDEEQGMKTSASSRGRVNLNTADRTALQTIEGIDGVRAERLLAYRESHGPFRDWSDIDEVPGFDTVLIQELREGATLGTKQR